MFKIILLGLLICSVLFLVVGGVYAYLDTPRKVLIRRFKKVKLGILAELEPSLKDEGTRLITHCEAELYRLLRAKDSLKEMEKLAEAMDKEISSQDIGENRLLSSKTRSTAFRSELKEVDQRLSEFFNTMMDIQRVSVTQDALAVQNLQELSNGFMDSLEARREVFESMTLDRFDEKLMLASEKPSEVESVEEHVEVDSKKKMT